MKILRINHLGLAPKNPLQAIDFFQNVLQLPNHGEETIENQNVLVNMFACENSQLEILTPTSVESPIAKFLQAKGSGIHHIALEVDNLEQWLEYLKNKEIPLIDNEPRLGAHHTRIAFIHPKATGGILVELVQLPE